MSDSDAMSAADVSVDVGNLYREESYSDMRAASVRRLIPVKQDGSDDLGRPAMYIGDTTLMTQVGPLPVQFQIEADSLQEAFERFPEGVRSAIARLNERAREMAREEASRIVVPTAMPPGSPGAPGPLGGGGRPKGGGIVLK